jgi:hypothetical protein
MKGMTFLSKTPCGAMATLQYNTGRKEVTEMITLRYQLVDPRHRKNVDLRYFEDIIANVVASIPGVTLDKVKSDYYQITLSHILKNRVVRKLGNRLAKTLLRVYARPKKGKRKSFELFRRKKSKK